jgi:DNA gyrase/topoisomerase IV subunit A
MDEHEFARINDRLHILDGLLRGLEQRVEIDAVVWDAADAEEAHVRLTGEPFSFSATQAHHILDAPLRRRTVVDRTRLSNEAADLRAALDE